MKFPRNTRLLQGRFDFAPYAAVFFLLWMFLLLGSLIYTPGVSLQLPVANDLPGTDRPTVNVAVDALGRFYFENQTVNELELKGKLRAAVEEASEPLTLVIHADKTVSCEDLVRLAMLARSVHIQDALLATLPPPSSTP